MFNNYYSQPFLVQVFIEKMTPDRCASKPVLSFFLQKNRTKNGWGNYLHIKEQTSNAFASADGLETRIDFVQYYGKKSNIIKNVCATQGRINFHCAYCNATSCSKQEIDFG